MGFNSAFKRLNRTQYPRVLAGGMSRAKLVRRSLPHWGEAGHLPQLHK